MESIFDTCFRHRKDISQVRPLFLSLSRKRISTTIFFYDAHFENQADSSDFAEDADIDEDDAEKLFVVIHSIVQRRCTNHLWKIRIIRICFRKETSTENSKKLIAKILKNRLSMERSRVESMYRTSKISGFRLAT